MSSELACTGRPLGEPRPYYETDLQNASTVGDLLCSCSVGDGLIHKEGWRFLLATYGIDGLLDIDLRNWDWLDGDQEQLIANARLSGYDPETDRFGIWDDRDGFVPQPSRK